MEGINVVVSSMLCRVGWGRIVVCSVQTSNNEHGDNGKHFGQVLWSFSFHCSNYGILNDRP
jgi:hypothetical protein